MKYYIIGNGFDIAHGLKTSYSNFINYYKKFNCLTEADQELWSDFENSFAKRTAKVISETYVAAEEISYEIYVEDYYDVIGPTAESCEAYNSFLDSFKEEDIIKFSEEFKKYLQILDYNSVEKKYKIEEGCAMLSFNYTNYAKDLYATKHFWNIHGHINDYILFGYNSSVNTNVECRWILEDGEISYDGGDPSEFLAYRQRFDREEDNNGILNKADEIAGECMDSIKKITDKYDKALNECRQSIELEFFDTIIPGDEIIIIGHSLGDADSDFFNKLDTECTELGVPIICYYYKDSTALQAIISKYKWNFILKNVDNIYI